MLVAGAGGGEGLAFDEFLGVAAAGWRHHSAKALSAAELHASTIKMALFVRHLLPQR